MDDSGREDPGPDDRDATPPDEQARLPPWERGAPEPPPGGAPPTPSTPPANQPPPWGTPPTQPTGWGAPPPPPAWGAPPPAPAGPPGPGAGKRRGWGWLWALITTLVVLTGLAIAAVVLLVSTLTEPADATNAYLRDLRSGNSPAAYSHLCAARRAETSRADFAAEQQARVQQEGDIIRFDVTYSLVHSNGHATTRYTLDRFLQLQRWEVDLVKEGGQWRLCHFRQLVR